LLDYYKSIAGYISGSLLSHDSHPIILTDTILNYPVFVTSPLPVF